MFLFVSHSSKDDSIVNKMLRKFSENGIDYWVDHIHIDDGTHWDNEIQDALKACDAGLFILSRNSHNSQECIAEYRAILDQKKTLFLAVSDSISEDDISYRLKIIHHISLYKDFDGGMDNLIGDIRRSTAYKNYSTNINVNRKTDLSLALSSKTPRTLVRLKLNLKLKDFDDDKRENLLKFLSDLSSSLRIDDIVVNDISEGSVILILELPEEQARHIQSLFKKYPELFKAYDISSFELIIRSSTGQQRNKNKDKPGKSYQSTNQPYQLSTMGEQFPKVHLFISYSHVDYDKNFVDELVKKLESIFGYDNVWYDGRIVAGTNWDEEIKKAIRRCNVFIYAISKDSLESEECGKEFRLATELNKSLLPILISGNDAIFVSAPAAISDHLRRIQYVNMTGGVKDDAAFARLLYATNEAWATSLSTQESRRVITGEEPSPPPVPPPVPRRRLLFIGIGIIAIIIIVVVFSPVIIPSRNDTHTNTPSVPTQPIIQTDTPILSPASTNTATYTSTPTNTATRTPIPTHSASSVTSDAAATATFDALNTRVAAKSPTATPTSILKMTCTPTSTPYSKLTPDKTATSKFQTLDANLAATRGVTATPDECAL